MPNLASNVRASLIDIPLADWNAASVVGEAARQLRSSLLEATQLHRRTDALSARCQRDLTQQRAEQRGLAAAVRPDDHDPLAVVDLQRDRPQTKRAERYHRVAQAGHQRAAAWRGSDRHPQVPRLARLEVHVMTRGAAARELALALGAASAQGADQAPPVKLDAAILFAPVGDLVVPALEALDRGGTLAIAGIYLSDIPALNYERHLFLERQIRSVTSNTRNDAREFLAFAGRHRIAVTTPEYALDRAEEALADLSAGRMAGAAVLRL